MKRVGVLARPGGLAEVWKAGFPEGFAAQGFAEGRNLELLWFDVLTPGERGGASEAVGRMVAGRMLRADLDCMVTHADPGTRYLQEVTRTIPIVTDVEDPVAAGFAQSLSRPGGNITGLHQGGREIALKNIELLRRLVPGAKCIAWIGWAGLPERMKSVEAAAHALGVRPHMVPIAAMGAETFPALRKAVSALRAHGCTIALADMPDDASWKELSALALKHRIAVAAGSPVDGGAVLYYSSNRNPEDRSVRRIPVLVSRILRGMQPADMPFEGPSRFQLFLDLRTAAGIGIAIPPEVLMQADQVIR